MAARIAPPMAPGPSMSFSAVPPPAPQAFGASHFGAHQLGFLPPPFAMQANATAAGGMTPGGTDSTQHRVMSTIVEGMKRRDIGVVAAALQRAVETQVSLPDGFLDTVKKWMTSRQQSAVSSKQLSTMAFAGPNGLSPGPAVVAPTAGGFGQLKMGLDEAFRRNDQEAVRAILVQGAQLAAAGGGGMTPGALSAGGLTPGGPTYGTLPGAMTPMGFGTRPSLPGGVSPGFLSGSMTPFAGGMTPMVPGAMTPTVPPRPGAVPGATTPGAPQSWMPSVAAVMAATMSKAGAPVKVPPRVVPARVGATDFKAVKADPGTGQQPYDPSYSPTVAEDDDDDDIGEPAPLPPGMVGGAASSRAVVRPPARGPVAPGPIAPGMVKSEGDFAPPTILPVASVSQAVEQGRRGSEPKLDVGSPASMPDFGFDHGGGGMEDNLPLGNEPTAEEIANFLRSRPKETALFKSINQHFNAPGRERIRRVVEADPMRFIVVVDKVTLREDKEKKESLNQFCRQLVRSHLTRKRIQPDDKVMDAIYKAANLALQAPPQGLARVLNYVAQSTLRKVGKVMPGRYPANMPLVLACIVDRVVMLERRQGKSRNLENALSSVIYDGIFQRWSLGIVPGSQFLANLLLTWERLGYFKTKHLQQCKKKVLLLVAYARAEGVPDSPDKERGTGWYRFVQREPGIPGCEAIAPRKLEQAPQPHDLDDDDNDSDVEPAPPAPAPPTPEAVSSSAARHAVAQAGGSTASDASPAPKAAAVSPAPEAAGGALPLSQTIIEEVSTVDSQAARDATRPKVVEVGTVESNPDLRGTGAPVHPEVSSAEPPTASSVPTVTHPPMEVDSADVGEAGQRPAKRPRTESPPEANGVELPPR
mmetsp:Transcript_18533/g.51641  ORF Transcript_18533/g.51641 Transcript_18533/m.51641 type:complete len:869 (-) Transcript_18533:86-2692(-)